MARHYSTRKMLRQTPNHLLKQFFEKLGHKLLCIEWRKLKHVCDDPLMISIGFLSDQEQRDIEAKLAEVHELAGNTGTVALVEAARALGRHDFVQEFPDAGHYHRAMWAWLNHPQVFEYATVLHATEHLSGKRSHSGLPNVQPRRSKTALAELATGISECLRVEEGRGKRCTVEHVRRQNGFDYFFAYPDDFVQTIATHDQHGNLRSQAIRPTFEIVFAYSGEEGSLHLYGPLRPEIKDKMAALFGQIILRIDIGARQYKRPYDLNRLKDRYFCLETDPADAVTACVMMLRLETKSWGRITLEPRTHRHTIDVYDMADSCLNGETVPWEDVDINKARLQFTFKPVRGRRAGTLKFYVTYPDRCNVQSQIPERIDLVHKYLRRWRIAHVRRS